MIIPNQMVQISINSKNKKYYEKLLNKTLKIADVINVSPENLMHGSCAKFYAKCDRCGNEKEVVGQSYFKAVDKHAEYLCEDCFKYRLASDIEDCNQSLDQKLKDQRLTIDDMPKITVYKPGESYELDIKTLYNIDFEDLWGLK